MILVITCHEREIICLEKDVVYAEKLIVVESVRNVGLITASRIELPDQPE